MATSIQSSNVWAVPAGANQKVSLWNKLVSFAANQKRNYTLWFFLTLVVHGVLILPVPAVLIYYFHAPDAVLAITMMCFFINIVANMGGAGIKTTIGFFAGSLLIHLTLILIYVL